MPAAFPDHTTPPSLPRLTVGKNGLIRLELELTIEAFDTIRKLADREGRSPGEILQKAVFLYKTCSDAIHEGFSVGTTKKPDALETMFTGF